MAPFFVSVVLGIAFVGAPDISSDGNDLTFRAPDGAISFTDAGASMMLSELAEALTEIKSLKATVANLTSELAASTAASAKFSKIIAPADGDTLLRTENGDSVSVAALAEIVKARGNELLAVKAAAATALEHTNQIAELQTAAATAALIEGCVESLATSGFFADANCPLNDCGDFPNVGVSATVAGEGNLLGARRDITCKERAATPTKKLFSYTATCTRSGWSVQPELCTPMDTGPAAVKFMTMSSEYKQDNPYPVSYAYDGNSATFCHTEVNQLAAAHWLEATLENPTAIGLVGVLNRQNCGANPKCCGRLYPFEVEVSSDGGTTWTQCAAVQEPASADEFCSSEIITVPCTASNADTVRVVTHKDSLTIAEFKIYKIYTPP